MCWHATPDRGKKKRNMFYFQQVVVPSQSMRYFFLLDLKQVKLILIGKIFTCPIKRNPKREEANLFPTPSPARRYGESMEKDSHLLESWSSGGIERSFSMAGFCNCFSLGIKRVVSCSFWAFVKALMYTSNICCITQKERRDREHQSQFKGIY